MRIPEEMVPVGRRFPALFRGEGVRGHRYHVFDEPPILAVNNVVNNVRLRQKMF